MKYEFIKNHEYLFPIEKMCNVLKITSSGYYKWKNRPFSKRLLSKEKIKQQITSIYSHQNNATEVLELHLS